jgi:hypothetical protein
LLNEELKKINEQVTINSKVIDKKIVKLYSDLDIDKFMRMIDRKLNKDEAESRFENGEQKMGIVDKCIIKVNTNLERLEVS